MHNPYQSLYNRIHAYHPGVDREFFHHLGHYLTERENNPAASAMPLPIDPLDVGIILTDLKLDSASIGAGMLAKLVIAKAVSLNEINKEFGEEVGFLLDKVVRVSLLTARTRTEAQAEDFRKMILATAQDIRVILVRLALCLQQVRQAVLLPDKAPERMAREVLEIYAPIAHRLGIHWIKSELEDLAFRLTDPEAYQNLLEGLKERRKGGASLMRHVVALLKKKLKKDNIEADVSGREKHLYSIWGKMARKNVALDDLSDLIGYRIIVRKKADCYRALGMIHSDFKPIPGTFKDYVALPKANGYQSLHTVVFGPNGTRMEIQIRTEKMHGVAESGVAAHWIYKQGGIRATKGATGYAWLKELLETHQSAEDPNQFLENVKIDLFPDEIYVFTPGGEIITLPRGSTPVDFAYAVHSEVGDHCQGAKINGRMMPLRTALTTGETVEILTTKNQHPSPNWLQFVVTGKAKYRITRWLSRQQRDASTALGRELLEREVRKTGHGFIMNERTLDKAVEALRLPGGVDELFYQVGASKLSTTMVVHRMFPELAERVEKQAGKGSRPVTPSGPRKPGVEGGASLSGLLPQMDVQTARCCAPIPGDPIVGIITTGKGVTIHHAQCPNLFPLVEQPERWIQDIAWPKVVRQTHLCRLRATVRNQKGVLAMVSEAVTEAKASIIEVHTRDRDREPCSLEMDVEVTNLDQLEKVIDCIRAVPLVLEVERMRG